MTTLSNTELEQAWKERCQRGTFSQSILGLGTVRIMGKSGDVAIQFPRIASLDALGTLEPDEQYALQTAQRIIEQAHVQQRTVFAVAPGKTPERVTAFCPDRESLLIVARVAGG